MKKKLPIFLCFLFMIFSTQNVFGYNYRKHIYDWRGENIYNVVATEFTDGSNIAMIIDIDNGIFYCFVCPDKSSAMEMYQRLSRMNVGTLSEVIRITRWKYWFTQDEYIYYKDNGML